MENCASMGEVAMKMVVDGYGETILDVMAKDRSGDLVRKEGQLTTAAMFFAPMTG